MVPAGIALHARLADALEDRARADVTLAPRILEDRSAATNDALMMRAKDFAHQPGLASALAAGDRGAIDRIANTQRPSLPAGIPVVVGQSGRLWAGPLSDSGSVAATRAGKMPVDVISDSSAVHTLALAPVELNGRWLGAAGFAIPMTDDAARTLASLTRSDVIIVSRMSRRAVASTLDSSLTRAILESLAARGEGTGDASAAHTVNERVAVATAHLGAGADVVFARVLRDELAILPTLRRIALISAGVALGLALILGTVLAHQIGRPVHDLARAARALGEGDFAAPLPRSRFEEVATVSETFAAMRAALAARLAELETANRELEDRAARLAALQNDMMHRERLAASAQLVAQLAHEIRNPVATLRNLLEVIQRRAGGDAETHEYAALAIDELLRMHELAERMLDLNRPRDPSLQVANVGHVVRDVVRLVTAGNGDSSDIAVTGVDDAVAAIPPDALKQVLLNLIQNAREAVAQTPAGDGPRIQITVRQDAGMVRLQVSDNGPGIPAAILSRIFDPFFTTKDRVQGVGLGLFVAEGMVRAAGGRLTARNIPEGGAAFLIQLPAAAVSPDGQAMVAHGTGLG